MFRAMTQTFQPSAPVTPNGHEPTKPPAGFTGSLSPRQIKRVAVIAVG
jgi:hypothetical protein